MLRTRAGLAATLLLSLAALAGCGQVSTVNNGDADVETAPTITSQPASQVVSSGQQASFNVVAQGSDPLQYQWRRNGTLINGAAASTYTTPATESDDGAAFSVVVSNPAGTVESETAQLTVKPVTVAPSIVTQPKDQTITAGQSATFSVAVSGTDPLSYQWQRNGAPISGAAAASYTTAVASTGDNGTTFSVVVSNSAGSVTSSLAKLIVTESGGGAIAPAITAQPADQTAKSGQTAIFTVTATGTAPLSFQWLRNGAPLSGATAASYTTPALATSDSGAAFSVSIKNSAGSITSRAARLTVSGNPPTITAQPADQSVKAGQTALFSVQAGGTAPLSYQWRRNGAAIAGATSASYVTPAAVTADSGATFSVVVSNAAGNTTSRAAQLTVSAVAPSITTQPANATVTAGASATFSVAAAGTAPLSYQWQRSGTAIPGATAASYTTAAAVTADSGATFSVVVSNAAGNITSRAAQLTVNAVAPSITTQPASATVIAGASATFSVVAAGTAPLSYQWQRSGTAIPGANAASYTTAATVNSDSGTAFAVVVTNSAGTVTSRAAVLTVSSAAPTITSQPADQSVRSGQTATFSVTATGTAPLTYQWRKNGTAIPGATGTSFTTAATTTSDSGTAYSVVVSNGAGNVTSRNAQLTVSAAVTQGSDVVTYKNDLARTGQNLGEKILTPANVNSSGFGKLRFLSTDGKVDAQPLYLSALSVGGSAHNVVFVATENDSVYAFDADNGAKLWKASLVPAGERVDLPQQYCSQVSPTIGITSTPVIDRTAGAHGIIYLVAMTKSNENGSWHHRLHALDVTTGAEALGGPQEITASYPAAGGTITFDPVQYEERAALLLSNHTIYTTWTSHCDNKFYTGWVIAYSQTTLQRTAVLNVAPNSGGMGPAIWMAGGGPAADAAGNVYLLTANGAFEETLDGNGFPNQHDYANSFLKLATGGGSLSVADYFALSNTNFESNTDMDLGSGGIMLLPDLTDAGGTTRHLAVGAGKDGNIYVVNRDAMGHFSRNGNNIWQQLTQVLGNSLSGGSSGGVWSTPAYFNGNVYYGATGGHLTAFTISGAKLSATPASASIPSFFYPGTSPVISANGTNNGIVWAHQNTSPAVLYAFDATNTAHQLYDSSQAGGRDDFGPGNKFITPMVADGKVFVGTTNGVAVFGLLN